LVGDVEGHGKTAAALGTLDLSRENLHGNKIIAKTMSFVLAQLWPIAGKISDHHMSARLSQSQRSCLAHSTTAARPGN